MTKKEVIEELESLGFEMIRSDNVVGKSLTSYVTINYIIG